MRKDEPTGATDTGGRAPGDSTSGPASAALHQPALIRPLALAPGWCGSWFRGGLALVVLCMGVLLPGLFTLPPIDRDESRFAQASRQMIESGDYTVPRVQDRPRINKPPLIYWLQAGAVCAITGGDVRNDAVWMYRVPGVLCAVLSVLLTWRLGCSMFDPRVGWLAAALLAVCPLLVFDAHQARADQLLLTTVAASQLCLWQVLRLRAGTGRSWWMRMVWTLALWLCVGLGVLAKGPITPLVTACTIVAFCALRRDWTLFNRVRPLFGAVILAAMVVPWLLAVSHRIGWGAYWSTVYAETIGRSTQTKEGHFGPPGYHLLLLVVLFFPGSLLTGLAVTHAWKQGAQKLGAWHRWKWAGRPADLFLMAWIVPAWIVFELVLTKLPHYTMPMYPALALLTARAAITSSAPVLEAMRSPWARRGFLVWGVVGGVVVAAVPAGASWWLTRSTPGANALPGFAAGAAGLALAIAATYSALQSRPLRALVLAGLALIGTYAITFQFLLPANQDMLLSVRLARVLGSDRPCAAVGYQEDSLVFLTRGRIDRIDAGGIAAWAHEHPDGMIVVRKGEQVPANLWAVEAEFRGFNYARTKSEVVQVYTRERPRVEPGVIIDPRPPAPDPPPGT